MIYYPNKPATFATPRQVKEFTKWSKEQLTDFEAIYDLLDELAYQINECDPSKPFWVIVDTLTRGFADCLVIGNNHDQD